MALGPSLQSTTPSPSEDPPARTRWSRHGHVASFGDGRVCSHEECNTTLSRYNETATCSVHDGKSRRRR